MISGTRGYVSMGYQAGMEVAATPANKKRFFALEESLAPNEMADSLPTELSGKLFPNHTYKNGVFGAGGIRLIPRLGDTIAYPVYGVTGVYTSAATGVAAYKHTFKVDDTNQANLPWATVERYVPDKTGTNGFQERFEDARVAAMTLTFGAAGPAMAELAIMSRKVGVAVNDETGAPANSPDDLGETIGLSCSGSFVSSISELAAAKLTSIQLINTVQYSPPQENQVFGSYYMADIVPLGRTAAVRIVANLDDKALYQKLVYNAAGVSTWTPVVTTGDLDIKIASAGNIAGETIPYSLRFTSPNVKFLAGRLSLTPAKLVRFEIMAQVNSTTSAAATYQYELVNKVAGYLFT